MEQKKFLNELLERVQTLGIQLISVLIDAIFLAVWVFLQWGTNYLIQFLEVQGIEKWVLLSFKMFFGLSSFGAVAIPAFKDLAIISVKAWKEFKQETRKNAA